MRRDPPDRVVHLAVLVRAEIEDLDVAPRRLFEDGQAATYILFMVARQLRILLGVKELAAQRLRPDDIAAQLGQRPFVVRKALEQVRGFSDAELAQLHDQVLALDHASKTGRVEAATGLELLVAQMCR